MKKILLIILLTAITGLQAQNIDIASIGKGRAFKLTGGLSANFAYMDSNLPQEGFVTQQGDIMPPEGIRAAAGGISKINPTKLSTKQRSLVATLCRDDISFHNFIFYYK